MTAIAFGLLWAAWTGGLYGWCLIRGYDISLPQLVNPVHTYKGPWPPPPAVNTVIFPSGSKSSQAAAQAPGPAGPTTTNIAGQRGTRPGQPPVVPGK